MAKPDPDFDIEFICENPNAKFPWESRLRAIGRQLLIEEKKFENVNVILASDETVRVLNKNYRRLDKVTDVLSFEWHEPYLLGEIYIARDQVKRQAPNFGNSFFAELKRVFVHGLLHLSGYDHIKAKDRVKMRKRECEFLKINYYREQDV